MTPPLMKIYVHHHTMVINTQYKFTEISSIAYLVIAEDRHKDGRTTSNLYPSAYIGTEKLLKSIYTISRT